LGYISVLTPRKYPCIFNHFT